MSSSSFTPSIQFTNESATSSNISRESAAEISPLALSAYLVSFVLLNPDTLLCDIIVYRLSFNCKPMNMRSYVPSPLHRRIDYFLLYLLQQAKYTSYSTA